MGKVYTPGSQQAMDGWTPSGFWSEWAEMFTDPGSEQRLIAAMTHAVPTDFYGKQVFGANGNPVGPDSGWAQEGNRRLAAKGNNQPAEDMYMSEYGEALRKRLRDQYKAGMPDLKDRGVAIARDSKKSQLKDDFEDIDRDSSARGMYNSLDRQARRDKAAAQRSGELGAEVPGVLSGIDDQANAMDADIAQYDIGSKLKQANVRDVNSQAFFDRLKRDMLRDQERNKQMGSLFGGVGSAVGSIV